LSEDSLEPLITQCPTCRTRFRVTEAQLNVAAGRVRCGACLSVFAGIEHLVLGAGSRLRPGETPSQALDALLDELRADSPAARSSKPESRGSEGEPSREPPRDVASGRDRPSGRSLEPDVRRASAPDDDIENGPRFDETAEANNADADGEIGAEIDGSRRPTETIEPPDREPRREARKRAPETRQEPAAPPVEAPRLPETVAAKVSLAIGPEDLMEPRRRRRRWWIPVAAFVGATLLAAQVLYLQFDAWAKNPDIRPVYEWLCPRLNCQLPVMRSLDDIRSKNLIVRDDPDAPGQLMVDALIVNQARFAQPFPVIELRFSSMDGRPLAALRFKPEEYLAGELKGATKFPPLTPVHIAFTIADPGADAVSYYIQFR
jgi:predicted Zn finger-like uncharacterized protein